MSKQFKRQADATKWLSSVYGVFLDNNTSDGKWMAQVPDKSEAGVSIAYGDTPLAAINAVSEMMVD